MGNCLESISQWCECEKGDEDEEENNNVDAKSRQSKATVAHLQLLQKQKSFNSKKQINKHQEVVKNIQQQHPSSHFQISGQAVQPRRIKLISQVTESEENSLNTTNINHDTSHTGIANFTNNNNNVTIFNNQTTIIQEEEEQESDHILSIQINSKQKQLQRCNTANNINPKMKIQSENIKQLLLRCKTGNIDANEAQENIKEFQNQKQMDQEVELNDINIQQNKLEGSENIKENIDKSQLAKQNQQIQMDSFNPQKYKLQRDESLSQNSYTNNLIDDDDSLINFRQQQEKNTEFQQQQQLKQCKQTIGRLLKLRFELLQKKKAQLEQNEVNFDSSLDQQIESNNIAITNQQKYFQQMLEQRNQNQQQLKIDRNNQNENYPQKIPKNNSVQDQTSKSNLIKVVQQIILQNGVTKQLEIKKQIDDYPLKRNESHQKQLNKIQNTQKNELVDNQSFISRKDTEQIEQYYKIENFCTPTPVAAFNDQQNEQQEKQFLRQRNGTINNNTIQQTLNVNQKGYSPSSYTQYGNQFYQNSKTLGFKNTEEPIQLNTKYSHKIKEETASNAQKNNFISKKNSIKNQGLQQTNPLKKEKSSKTNQKLETFIFMGDQNENGI